MRDTHGTDSKTGHPAKSGQQVGAENVERLRVYLGDLNVKGACIPSRNGKADKSAVAIACGFNRQTLYNNPEAIALLEKAVEEIGLDKSFPPKDGKTMHLQQQMDARDRRIQRLEQLLTTRMAENSALRQEVKELKEQLLQYTLLEEAISTNGRKYRP
ncbi:MAG: hypothetical protein QOH49_2574 [Acidobacteriota bacterium]|jgi:hypothetical protein|nr:hypothetical protein [Acidobacteriota bacterium]